MIWCCLAKPVWMRFIVLSTKETGFSLIEVLVALVIVAISLGAILQTTQVSVANTILLKDMIAGQNSAWNKILVDQNNDNFQLEQKSADTPVKQIKKITVTAKQGDRKLSTLTRYIYVEAK